MLVTDQCIECCVSPYEYRTLLKGIFEVTNSLFRLGYFIALLVKLMM
jgi:hypothetical protein